MSDYRLQDELRSRLPRREEVAASVNPDDRYIQMLKSIISQVQTQGVRLSPENRIMIKLLAFSAANGISDPQKKLSVQSYINSVIQTRGGSS